MLFVGGNPAVVMNDLRKFSTIRAAEGRLFVAAKNQLFAFSPAPDQR